MRKRVSAAAIALEPDTRAQPSPIWRRQDAAMTSPAERELKQIAAAQRDPRDFAPLYDAYADLVWRVAMSRLGNRERAADVTHQTFVKAIQALPGFQPKLQGEGTSFKPWLMMIARNAIIDEQRKHRPTADIDAPEMVLADTAPGPEHEAIAAEERSRVRDAIARLSPKQQRMVELRIAGYSGKEIAQIMGMTVNGVRTAHSRAYSTLRDLLAENEGSAE